MEERKRASQKEEEAGAESRKSPARRGEDESRPSREAESSSSRGHSEKRGMGTKKK